MMGDSGQVRRPRASVFRDAGNSHVAVSNVELFFDLVYVFAITQLSHYLLAHHDLAGVVQQCVLFLAVWWAWIWMAWATNWLDPERGAVRVMIFLVMLASLAMSASLPRAFADGGMVFALSYLAMQILRTAWLVWLMRHERPKLGHNLLRAVIWFVMSAPFWLAGAVAEPDLRLVLWLIAIGLNYLAPSLLFRLPFMGMSSTRDFAIAGHHMAERCGLLIIIALGEGIMLIGATFAEMAWTTSTVAALLTAFIGSVALWWVYFDVGSARGAEHIANHADSGRVARDAFTYGHLPIVGGIIVSAVADEMLLAHPLGHSAPLFIWTAIGGPSLFLFGVAAFKKVTSGRPWWPLSHLAGLGFYALLALWAVIAHLQPLTIAILSAAIMILVAIWEWGSFHGGWLERGMPAPRILRERAQARWAASEAKRDGTSRV